VTQPVSATVDEGRPISFSVEVASLLPVVLQWQRDGQSLRGASNATLTLSNPLVGDAGIYSVVVSNPAGTTVSAKVSLVVNPAPSSPGRIDLSFYAPSIPGLASGSGRTNATDIAVQWDDKVVLNADAGVTRLQTDGEADTTFDDGRGVVGSVVGL
jgi:hypothetical protein